VKNLSLPSRANIVWLLMLLAAAPWAAGCGYHFVASGSGLPSNATTIYVAKFQNLSRNTGLQEEFARYLKDEIANHKRLVLVDDPASADLRLTGTIRSYETYPGAFNAVAEPSTYDMTMMVDARLVDRSNNLIWTTRGLSDQSEYATVANAVVVTAPGFLRKTCAPRISRRCPTLSLPRPRCSRRASRPWRRWLTTSTARCPKASSGESQVR
jgi:outer membrane lipopolysaccharide assembly protein LptE/RlpB